MTNLMRRKAGAAMIAFAVAANIPFTLLVDRFGYDDILREPPLDVLEAFRRGGPELILIWLAFALCALAFLWVSDWVGRAIREAGGVWPGWAATAGAATAVAQAAGLSRWVFVIPGLAEQAASGDPATHIAFGCGLDHDLMVGMLMFRAQNVRALMQEEAQASARGSLAAPSQQK